VLRGLESGRGDGWPVRGHGDWVGDGEEWLWKIVSEEAQQKIEGEGTHEKSG
jgi:hypothetical protein